MRPVGSEGPELLSLGLRLCPPLHTGMPRGQGPGSAGRRVNQEDKVETITTAAAAAAERVPNIFESFMACR